MTSNLARSAATQAFLDKIAGLDTRGGDPRVKAIVRRIVANLFEVIDEFDVSDEEFWSALGFFAQGAPEFGLMAPGLGIERFLDIRADAADERAQRKGGTPRTIEGPLYIAGAPLSRGVARLDSDAEPGDPLVMRGRVLDMQGRPLAGAVVDVWHANINGGYSGFDPSQPSYNLRRRIETDAEGRYTLRTRMPSGYGVPEGGHTHRLLNAIGRHGRRPAHIHFFVSAPGKRHLTTQINIDGDPLLHDDFAYATRDELIPPIKRLTDAAGLKQLGLTAPVALIEFDFQLPPAAAPTDAERTTRARAEAAQFWR